MSTYDTVLPVYGPLRLPPAVPGRECSHHAPESCPRCDGTEAERFEPDRREREAREVTPPCLIETRTA